VQNQYYQIGNDERIFGRPFGRPFFYGRPFFGRPRPFFPGPFLGGVLGGVLGSTLFNPYLYGYYPYPYPYPPYGYWY